MKAAELTVGREVAITDGTDRYAREPSRATRAIVAEEPEGGYVRVKLLEDANSKIGRSWMSNEGNHKKGATLRIETRKCWMPWEEVAEVIKRDRERQAAQEKAAEEREEKLVALQARVDQAGGKGHPLLRWARSGYGGKADTEYVFISTEALEAILDKLDGGS